MDYFSIREVSLEKVQVGHLDREGIRDLLRDLRDNRRTDRVWLAPDILDKDRVPVLARFLSALANSPRGGSLVVGLHARCAVVPGFRAAEGRKLVREAASLLNTIVEMAFDYCAHSGGTEVLLVHVPAQTEEQICCLQATHEAFMPTEDSTGGIRVMKDREIKRVLEGRGQHVWDEEIVEDATMDDLDATLLPRYVAKRKSLANGTFDGMTDEEVLLATKVVRRDARGIVRPTLAGLLCLGTNPQELFPQLMIAVERYSGYNSYSEPEEITGSIPAMIQATVAMIIKKMRVTTKCKSPQYKTPMGYSRLALRELLVNIVQHRDYSEQNLDDEVLITITDDDMEIFCPGTPRGGLLLPDVAKQEPRWQRNRTLSAILQATPWPGEQDGFVGDIRGNHQFALNCLDRAGVSRPSYRNHATMSVVVLKSLWDVQPEQNRQTETLNFGGEKYDPGYKTGKRWRR